MRRDVLLAGYLRPLGPAMLEAYGGRIYNTHPALLPAHGGRGMYGDRVHAAVLAAGDERSGATVHLVTADYDAGPIVAAVEVPVLPATTSPRSASACARRSASSSSTCSPARRSARSRPVRRARRERRLERCWPPGARPRGRRKLASSSATRVAPTSPIVVRISSSSSSSASTSASAPPAASASAWRRPMPTASAPSARALTHVGAAHHAAVDDQLDAPADGVDDLAQAVERRRRMVEVAPAVVGDVDRVDAVLDGELGVLRGLDALDDQRHAGALADPVELLPRQPRLPDQRVGPVAVPGRKPAVAHLALAAAVVRACRPSARSPRTRRRVTRSTSSSTQAASPRM